MSVTIKSTIPSQSQAFRQAMQNIKSKVAKVGWFTHYLENGHPSVAEVALQNELGNPARNIPPRPFIQPTIQEKSQKWIGLLKYGVNRVLSGKEDIETSLERVGLQAQGDIQKTISNGDFEPLKPITIQNRLRKRGISQSVYEEHIRFVGPRKKGHVDTSLGFLDKPLVDSGYMRDSITTVVENETGGYQ